MAKAAIQERLVAPETKLWVLRDMFFGAMEYSARTMMFVHNDDDVNAYTDKLMRLILTHEKALPHYDIIDRLENIADRLEDKF